MNIATGLSVDSEPSYQLMLERATQEAQVMAAGKKELAFLLEPDRLVNARIANVDGQYFFKVEIPVPDQQDMFPQGRRRGVGARGGIQRNDILQQAANDAALQAIGQSATLVDRVARAMATSQNLRAELLAIEKKEGVDTRPARRHIYRKQPGFFVEIEAQRVEFGSYAVRTAAASPGELMVTTAFSQPRSEATVYAGVVEETTATTQESAVGSGKRAHFRFVGLNWWQKTVLECAKNLALPVKLAVTEIKSTCTDKFLPLDVNAVSNFDELLKKTFVGLSEVLEAANDAEFDDLETVPQQVEKNA